jgi:hypothetical protein
MWHAWGRRGEEMHRVLVGNLKERLCGRIKHRWEDNIKMDLKEVEWEGVD